MGTRSLTRVFEDDDLLITIYRQMDGYPSGMGADLAEFLKDITIVNGISPGEKRRIANGMRCLAAQLVAHLKDGPGSIYLYAPKVKDASQEYEYNIRGGWGATPVTVECLKVSMSYPNGYDKPARIKKTPLFVGCPEAFAVFCKDKDA